MSAKHFGALTVFAIAFGIEEAIVVLYLRLLTAHGFAAAEATVTQLLPGHAYALELEREFCTLVVLGALAWLAAGSLEARVRAFCFTFGVWDIVYYIALWVLSGTPSFTSYDVLFLIPVPWIAPVWAAMAFAVVLVLLGMYGVAPKRRAALFAGFTLAWLSFLYVSLLKAHAYPVWLFVPAFACAIFAVGISRGDFLRWPAEGITKRPR
jgi:hypothetical protein